METQVYNYWIEVTGKAPRKRKAQRFTIDTRFCALVDTLSIADCKAKAQAFATENKLRDASYRVKRTVVTRCEYDNGIVSYMVPMFDVNLTIMDGTDLVSKK